MGNIFSPSAALPGAGPLETVPFAVELPRYIGLWYEISRIPNSFQSDEAQMVTAEYSLNDDGTIKVLNSQYVNGEFDTATAKAWPTDENNTKLKVQFFWPFSGDYWIIQLGNATDYGYAVVGAPNRKFGWVLNREPTMNETQYTSIMDRLTEQGYDTSFFVRTPQDGWDKARAFDAQE